MECSNADELMMKYMDSTITDAEAQALNKHLSECSECKKNFSIYDEIVTGFAEIEMINAPEDFEAQVMLKIEDCGVTYNRRDNAVDNLFTAVLGIVSVLFGFGFMLIANRDQIMNYLTTNEFFSSYGQIIYPMMNIVTTYTDNLISVLNSAWITVSSTAADYRYVLLGAFVALLAVQYILHRRAGAKEIEEV